MYELSALECFILGGAIVAVVILIVELSTKGK